MPGRTREIITCQIGPFSNWVGSHFWNTQDDARHPLSHDVSGDAIFDDEQADAAVLYRASPRSQLMPRLIVCDAADAFGNLSSAGGVAAPMAATHTATTAVDPLVWAGSVTEVVHEQRKAHAFAQMMSTPVIGDAATAFPSEGYDVGDYDEEDEEDEEDESDRGSPIRRPRGSYLGGRHSATASSRGAGPAGGGAGGAGGGGAAQDGRGEEEEEEEVTAASFDFEASVTYWSDYLQAHLHARSLAPLKPHVHGYSSLARFPDGACVVEKEEDCPGGPGLVERFRRFLEESDSVQGFHLLVDADGGFGGAACALLTQIRDDYSRAPCVALGSAASHGRARTRTRPPTRGGGGRLAR